MNEPVDAREAAMALDAIAFRQQQVIDEIDMPGWYWAGLGAGWVALGAIADVGNAWFTTIATLAFGACHSWVFSRVQGGRRRTSRLSVRADVVAAPATALVISYLLILVGVTVAVALLAQADGAGHPATWGGLVAGVAVACGGPTLMAAVRRRSSAAAARAAGASAIAEQR